MIISASRRTDIPGYYSDWLLNRITARYVYVRNPLRARQVSTVSLAPELVDCIVLWSKNPQPMLAKLRCLEEYAYYFQFTLNPYDQDIEAALPAKSALLATFKQLSDMIGPRKIVWRYDPVLLNTKYTPAYHIDHFLRLAAALSGYTEKVTFSFIDFYAKNAGAMKAAGIDRITIEQKNIIARAFAQIAAENHLAIDTCAEDIDLSQYNIARARCIDDRLIAKITGRAFTMEKDKNQRRVCGCVSSIDIGAYHSCVNGCVYCYANYSQSGAAGNFRKHRPDSPLLIGELNDGDTLHERKVSAGKTVRHERLL